MIRLPMLRGHMEVWVCGGGQQWPHPAPASTSPQTGFVTQGTGLGLEEKHRGQICVWVLPSGLWEDQTVSSAHFPDALRPLPSRAGGDCWKSSPLPTVPRSGRWRGARAQALHSELLVNPLLVLVRLQLELVAGDLAVLVAVLVLEHVPYGFLRVLPRHEASFALTDLSLDEGGELGERRAREGEREPRA